MKYLNQINLLLMVMALLVGGYAGLQTLLATRPAEAVTVPALDLESVPAVRPTPASPFPAEARRPGTLRSDPGVRPSSDDPDSPVPAGMRPPLAAERDAGTTSILGSTAASSQPERSDETAEQSAVAPSEPAQSTFQPGTQRPVPPVGSPQEPLIRQGEAEKRQSERPTPPVKGSLGKRPPQ